MKTSDLILTLVAGSFTLLMVTGIIQNRYFGKPFTGQMKEANMDVHSYDLPPFSYIVLQNQTNVSIESSGENKLVVQFKKGMSVPQPDFRVSSDTLYLGSRNSSQVDYATKIRISGLPSGWIKGINSQFKVRDFVSDRLSLVLDNCDVNIANANGKEVRQMTINGREGTHIISTPYQVDSLNVTLENSKATLPVATKNLSGSIKDHSELNVKDVDHFDFTKDETSKLTHWN